MASVKSESERLAAIERRNNELLSYFELFEAAFDELHNAVIKQVNAPNQDTRSYNDYPVMSLLDSGFPSFREAGSHQNDIPKEYVGTVQPRGLAGLFGGYTRPALGAACILITFIVAA